MEESPENRPLQQRYLLNIGKPFELFGEEGGGSGTVQESHRDRPQLQMGLQRYCVDGSCSKFRNCFLFF